MRLQLNILYARVNSDLSTSHSHKPRLLTNTYLVGWCISGYEISHKCSIGGPLTTFCFYYHWKQLGSMLPYTCSEITEEAHSCATAPLHLHSFLTTFWCHLCGGGEGVGAQKNKGQEAGSIWGQEVGAEMKKALTVVYYFISFSQKPVHSKVLLPFHIHQGVN